jgi:prepilin-type N-terminal cleavage/methylation domain-containing protein
VSRLVCHVRRRLRPGPDQAGFTLVEVMVAMLLLAIMMTGLARVTGAEVLATLSSHVQQAETSFMTQELEAFHSMSYTGLAMDPSQYTPSTTYTDPSSSTTYSVVFSSSGCGAGGTCIAYTSTLSIGNISFNETRVVVGVGTAPTWNYKKVFVTLASTSGPTFTYRASTDVSGATTNNPASANTLQVATQAVTSGGAQLNDSSTGNPVVPPDGFGVAVTGAGSDNGTTTDGAWSTTTLSAGTYTCTVSNPGAGYQDWVSYPGLSSTSTGSCIAPGTTTSQWEEVGCTTGAAKGSLTVTVENAAGTAVNGANITLTAIGSQNGKAPGALKTTSGVAQFNATVPAGPWGVSITGTLPKGYLAPLTGSSTCVWGATTSLLSMTLVSDGGTPKTATISVPVENSAPGGTSTLELQATDSSGNEYIQQQDLDSGTQSTFTLQVDATTTYTGSYTVTLYCTGVGGGASDGKPLVNWTTSSALAANSTWTPTGVSTGSPAAYEC